MKGSILIIAHNNLHLTKRTVATALMQDTPCDVLVISNYCFDGSNRWFSSKTGISTIYVVDQKSLAACWNQGIKAFWKTGADRVLVCNNDIELRPDTYRLLAGMRGNFVTAVSVGNTSQMGKQGDRDVDYLKSTARPHPDYSCFMIAKSVTDKGLWFDESYYPAYCEDSDHHVRMHRAGVHAVCVDLPYLHLGAQTLANAPEWEQIKIRRGADINREKFRQAYGCLPGSPEYADLFKPIERPEKVKKEWEPDIPPEV